MKYLKILLRLLVTVSLLLAVTYRVFELGVGTGQEEGRRESADLLVMFEYQTTIANFKDCSSTIHAALLSYVLGMEVSPHFDLVFIVYANHCKELLDHSSEILPSNEEEQDRRTAWVLFWWEGYMRQAVEVLTNTQQAHFDEYEIDEEFVKDLESLSKLRRRLQRQTQEAVLDVW